MLWHEYLYGKTGRKDVRFISEDLFHIDIIPALNDMSLMKAWTDKAYLGKYIDIDSCPQNIISRVNGTYINANYERISFGEAKKLISKYDQIVVKPCIESGQGKGVELLSEPYNLKIVDIKNKFDFTIQLPIKQHEMMMKLNKSSVNTIRISSGLWDGEVHIFSSFIRIGQKGEFADNFGDNRYFVNILKSGNLDKFGMNHLGKYTDRVENGVVFSDFAIPYYNDVVDLVKRMHKKLPHFKLVFWDICIGLDGTPIIIEINLAHPDITTLQMVCGPFFGDMTYDIITKVVSPNIYPIQIYMYQ